MDGVERIRAGKTVGLSFITGGVYFLVTMFKHSEQIQATNPIARGDWRVLYWMGFVTLGITWIFLYILNLQILNHWRTETDLPVSARGNAAMAFEGLAFAYAVMALVSATAFGQTFPLTLIAIVPTASLGAMIWAAHVNDTLDNWPSASNS